LSLSFLCCWSCRAYVGSGNQKVTVKPAALDARATVFVQGKVATSAGVEIFFRAAGVQKIHIIVRGRGDESEPEREYELVLFKEGAKGTPVGVSCLPCSPAGTTIDVVQSVGIQLLS
jgi:hypothetical protein